jgi:hypothetical protein
MSSKKRKSLSESGAGKTFGNIEDLKRELAEEGAGERPETGEPDAAGTSGGKEPAPDTRQSGASGSTSENKDASGGTIRMTFHIDEALAERLRDAVYWTPAGVTLSGTARDALRAAVEMIEERYNEGERFPPRDEDLRGGRPTS